VRETERFAASQVHYAGSQATYDLLRTGIALELLAAKTLALIMQPIMPAFSDRLWRLVEGDTPMRWTATPTFPTAGRVLPMQTDRFFTTVPESVYRWLSIDWVFPAVVPSCAAAGKPKLRRTTADTRSRIRADSTRISCFSSANGYTFPETEQVPGRKLVRAFQHPHIRPVVTELFPAVQANDVVAGPRANGVPVSTGFCRLPLGRSKRLRSLVVTAGEIKNLEEFLNHGASQLSQNLVFPNRMHTGVSSDARDPIQESAAR